VTIHRLSPKNQVTIPRDARVLAGGTGAIGHLRGSRLVVRKPKTQEQFNTVVLLTETELQRREDLIRANPALDTDTRAQFIARLNDDMKVMPIDAQNRIVLPAEFVAFLGLGDQQRDIKFICTNSSIQAWNPDHYASYADVTAQPAYDPNLAAVLAL
jgi:DNA-binding transcriptional regulator/RsmH inhibitor MraZ